MPRGTEIKSSPVWGAILNNFNKEKRLVASFRKPDPKGGLGNLRCVSNRIIGAVFSLLNNLLDIAFPTADRYEPFLKTPLDCSHRNASNRRCCIAPNIPSLFAGVGKVKAPCASLLMVPCARVNE